MKKFLNVNGKHDLLSAFGFQGDVPGRPGGRDSSMANQQSSPSGGKGNPGNFANDRQKARAAGHRGGISQGKATNPGNFANNREKAAAAGRKGGQHSHASKAAPAAALVDASPLA